MPIDPNIILQQTPIKGVDLNEIYRTRALIDQSRALAQERMDRARAVQQDAQEQAQIKDIIAQNEGDIAKSLPQISQINPDKALKYGETLDRSQKLKNDLQNAEITKRLKVNDYAAEPMRAIADAPPEQQQHQYDVARAHVQSARQMLGLPPASDQELPPVYDPQFVSGWLQKSDMAAKLLGDHADAKLEPYQIGNDPTPRMVRVTKDGRAFYKGQDVTDQIAPVAKESPPDKLQSPEQEAIKAYARDHGKDPSQLSQKELEQIHRGFKESGTVVRVTAGGAGGGSDAKAIAQAIINGDQPPDMKGLYRNTGPVRAELARQGYNLTKATEDWTSTQKYLATLNGAQQTRLRQAVEFTRESLPIVQDLVTQWDAAGLPLLSKANLDAAASGAFGAKQQSLAVRLKGQIADLTSELGTVYKGGNSSTDESLKLAAQNLQGNWSKQAALDALKQIDTNLTIRANSIRNTGPIANEGNQYAPQTGAPAAKKPDYRFNPATGKLERVQ